jgi:threonine dehydratase
VPVGGGGLLAGIAIAAEALRPDVEVVGVETELYPSMVAALDGGATVVPGGQTVAEGIAVGVSGALTTPIVRELVAETLIVRESTIEHAMNLFLDIEKTVAEGAGAAGLAAVLEHRERFLGRKVGLVLTGGNVDPRILASVIMRGLVRSGRLARLDVDISDIPGSLARVTTIIGELGGNIVEVAHQRLYSDLTIRSAVLELAIETRDRHHTERIITGLCDAGYHVVNRGT